MHMHVGIPSTRLRAQRMAPVSEWRNTHLDHLVQCLDLIGTRMTQGLTNACESASFIVMVIAANSFFDFNRSASTVPTCIDALKRKEPKLKLWLCS